MSLAGIADRVWYGDDAAAGVARALLAPASSLYGLAIARRNSGFDSRAAVTTAVPALSVGNLTVGGTGKTPVAAWCVAQLRARGARPAVVLRGVGDDEWRVHGVLNPGTPVIATPDRVAGALIARTKGADCVVLDDAFQHRRASRVADVVLISADRWNGAPRLLPSGPFREPLASLRRAQAVVITVKAANAERVSAVQDAVRAAAPDVPVAIVRLVPGEVRLAAELLSPSRAEPAQASTRPRFVHSASWLFGRAMVVCSAIGDPRSYERQLEGLGVVIVRTYRLADHHKFAASDAIHIARPEDGSSGVVCTLKDAVKLAPLWPREAPPLWYLSQSVVVDRGAEVLDRVFARVLTARAATAPTAG